MNHLSRWMDRLGYRIGRYAIHNLMMYIVVGMAVVFAADFLFAFAGISRFLSFQADAILRGEIWRLITFIFIPPNSSMLFIFFSLYFYWLLGSALEHEWGALRFNIYYLVGILGSVIAGVITGYATNYYLNMSLFFAFAILYPNFQLMIFFILPIKIKYLAYLDAAYFAFMFIVGGWPERISLLASLLNLMLFFGPHLTGTVRQAIHRARWRRSLRGGDGRRF